MAERLVAAEGEPQLETREDVENAKEIIEEAKDISKEAFTKAFRKLLRLTIEGYPRALRSTMAKRNEELRKFYGDQDAAAEDVKDQAAALTEEGKTWLLGCVPYVGLPAKVLYPTWRALRRVVLLAAIYGHDLETEEAQAKILHVFAGMRAVPAAEFALEFALQSVWVAFAGPAAGFIPVGVLASKVVNVEGHAMAVLGQETFTDGRRAVPEEEYVELLDPEPSREDYLALGRDVAAYALLRTRLAARGALVTARDGEKRGAALNCAAATGISAAATGATLGKAAAEKGVVLARGAAAVAPGAVSKGAGVAKGAVAGGMGAVGKMFGGSSTKSPAP